MKKGLTFEELQELAMANYENGGDIIVECWGQEEFDNYVKAFGPITKTKAMKMIKTYESEEREMDAARAWMSGEPEATETTVENKEDKTMTGTTKRAQGAVDVMDFEFNGTRYTTTRPNYYYKKVDGKQVRIPKAEFDAAWEASGEAERQAREAEQAKSDKEAEKKMGKKTTARKPRRSKDIAHESNGVTLTAKQVDFIQHLPDTCFYEHGLESTLWVDILAEEIGGQFANKPMTIGAMVSTLREKNVIFVAVDNTRTGNPKYIGFTELGQKIAAELGLN